MRTIRLLDPGHIPDGPVLRASQLALYARAASQLEVTEAWCAARQDEIASIEAEAHEAAYSEGLRQGIAAFEAAVTVYRARTIALAGEVERLVAGAAQRVMRTWPSRDFIAAALRDLLPDLSASDEIVIAIHPSCEQALAAALADLGLHRGTGAIPYLIERMPEMAEGDCTVFTENEVIKISVPLLTSQLLASIAGEIADLTARLRSEDVQQTDVQTDEIVSSADGPGHA